MSNDLAILDAKVPAYLKEMEVDAVTKSLMGGGGGDSTKRISIRGSVWRMMVNGKEIAKNEERSMNVVIVNAAPKVSRTFYAKQYSDGMEASAPDCWSADGNAPDAKAQNPQSKRCVDCPQNVAGSGQGNSRACRFSQRLAVVLANDIGGDVFQLTVPGASLFGEGSPGKWPLQFYAKMIGSKGFPVTAVVTEMRFDTDSATPKITFKPARVLEESEAMLATEQGKTEAAKRAVTMTVAQMDGVKSAPAAKAIAAPAAADVEDVVVEEPVKRTAKKDSEEAPKKDISSVLAEWDDE